MIHVIEHATIDSLKLLPLLFLAYVFVEVVEHIATPKLSSRIFLGKLAPLIGAGVGVIPQCGLSVVASNLYSKKHIALGTLIAVYISTSDEALPILMSNPQSAKKILPLIAIKLGLAIIVGYAVNLFVQKRELKASNECIGGVGCHHHEINGDEKKKFDAKTYIIHPLIHTTTVFIFILAVNLVFGFMVHYIGEDKIAKFFGKIEIFQPALAGIVGLIPNCASSVIITQIYSLGQLSLGGAVAGLSVNAGLGLAVLFKQNKNIKENIFVLLFLYFVSVMAGTIIVLVT